MKAPGTIGILTAALIALIAVAPALALLPTPCLDPPITFHTGNEPKIPVYYGNGEDRQILVFCVHVAPSLGYAETPVHMIRVFDDPEPPAETTP